MLSLILVGAPAYAADVDLFEPSAAFVSGRGSPQGEAPTVGDPGFVGGVFGGYARDPVVRRFDDGTVAPAVAAQLPVTVHAGWAVGDRVRFDALVPTYPWVDAPLTGFSGQALGDLRLQSTVRVTGGKHGRVGFAVVPQVTLPTGSDAAAVSRGVATGGLLALGADARHGGFVANVGAAWSPTESLEVDDRAVDPRAMGSATDAVLGVWARPVPALRIGVEGDAQVALASLDSAARNDTAAVHGFAQALSKAGFGVALGGGTGLLAGIGSPEYRVFGALTFATRIPDADGDGVGDNRDACPHEREDFDEVADDDGCPETDSDGDGILDDVDMCAMVPEDADGHDDEDGCPDVDNDGDGVVDGVDRCGDIHGPPELVGCPDRDADGVADVDDACPDVWGPAEGCPDRDGDGIADWKDTCPDEPCPPDEDRALSDGCPKTVWVTSTEVRISERVEFKYDSAELLPEALRILDGVVRVLLANPQLGRIEVQGHTDDIGPDEYNDWLSDERAKSVVTYMLSQGLPRSRLVPRGYGERVPLAANRTVAGRGGNRRVQFVILGLD
jgi:outer membrane protein OmpA-like peptidoglycan-associated protein